MAQYYPTSEVTVIVHATAAPRVAIESGRIRLSGSLAAHVYAQDNKTPVRILSVSLVTIAFTCYHFVNCWSWVDYVSDYVSAISVSVFLIPLLLVLIYSC